MAFALAVPRLMALYYALSICSMICYSSSTSFNQNNSTHAKLPNTFTISKNKSSDVIIDGEDHQHYDTIGYLPVTSANTANNENSDGSRKKRELSDWLIAPNTRWCGRGNTANGVYNHLGGASSADKCCRKHDHCQVYIPAMSNRYELFNYRPYTLSHCSCDRRFRTCLKMAATADATMVGKLFFNMVQTQCFVLKSEKICLQKSSEGGLCLKEAVKQKAYLRENKKF